MATVKIGDRDLDVWDRQAPGGLGRTKKLILAHAALAEASPADVPDKLAAIVLCYVGHNDGVTLDWLLDNLPTDCGELLQQCITTSGGKVSKPGEAGSP